jgi:restriction endonuclease S subunit
MMEVDGRFQERDAEEILRLPLPNGWMRTTVGEIGEVRLGRQRSPKNRSSLHPTRYLRAANITWDGLALLDVLDMEFRPEELNVYRLQPGDVLLSEASGSASEVGKPALWNGEIEDCCFQNTVIRFRSSTVFPRFALHVFSHFARNGLFSRVSKGVGIHHLSADRFSALPFPVPPHAEQCRIVAKIEELFSDLDAGVVALERVRANLKRYRAAVLKAAVEGKLTEDWRAQHPDTEPASVLLERILTERRCQWEKDQLAKFAQEGKQPPKGWQRAFIPSPLPDPGGSFNSPEEWAWTTVEIAGEVRLGRQRSPKNHQGPYMRPYLRVANVYEDRLDLSDVKQMNFTPNEYETFHLRDGDILLNEGQSIELVGRPAMYRGEVPGACFQNTLVRFRAKDGVLSAFALIVFRAYLRNQKFQRIARWTVNIAHLGADRFAKMGFPIPSLAEQEQIVADVERRLSVIDAIEEQVVKNKKRAARLRQGILKRAFEGRLLPQDPTDEPAEKLLERIRQQRQPATTMYNGRMGTR